MSDIVNPQVTDAVTQANHGDEPRRVILGEDALVRHLNRAHEMDMEHVAKAKAENDRAFERNLAAQKAQHEEHWRLVREHQAEIDALNIKQMNERERLADERMERSNAYADKRAREDQLHRLYVMFLREHIFYRNEAGEPARELALRAAKGAQRYFEDNAG